MSDRDTIAKFLASPEPIRWVFAGDSITHGALHTMGWRDYVELFAERVRWEMSRPRDCVITTAASGWRITNIRDDIEWSALQHRPHVLCVNVGMNDCADGGNGLHGFSKTYREVIGTVRARAPGVAIVVQTPNRILPADAQRAPHLSSYVQAVRYVASESGAVLVDHYADWEPAERSGTMNYWLSDALHPNECGHRAMARSLSQTLGMWDERSNAGRLFIP